MFYSLCKIKTKIKFFVEIDELAWYLVSVMDLSSIFGYWISTKYVIGKRPFIFLKESTHSFISVQGTIKFTEVYGVH